MKKLGKDDKLMIQFYLAVFMAVFGCILLVAGLYIPPLGVIDNSVLIAVGEVLTFVGSVFGLDYHYKAKSDNNK